MIKPALIGGLVFGVAAAVPVLNLANCLCCALVLGSGFLGAFLYSGECKKVGAEFRPGTGALVGLAAAPFYALATTLIGAVFTLTMGDAGARMLGEMMQNIPDVPPEQADMIERIVESSSVVTVGTVFMGFFVSLVVAAIFSTLGGLIGGAVFKVETPAPVPPAGSPPQAPGA
jgi:hypothetical protein